MSGGCKDLTGPIIYIFVYNLHFKITGLARRFSGRRNCPQEGYIVVVQSLVQSSN